MFSCMGNDALSDIDGLVYRWDFGDGEGTDWNEWSASATSHVYFLPGVYTISLSVMDDDGDTVTHEVIIEVVNMPPTAYLVRPSPSLKVVEDAVVFFEGRGADTPRDEGSLEIGWTIDGVFHDGAQVERAFPTSGVFLAILTVTDPGGAMASVTVTVTVINLSPEVVALVGPLEIEVNHSVEFWAVASDTPSDVEGLMMSWDFDDGSTSSRGSGPHLFTLAGNFKVTLTVTDDDGASVQRTFAVEVVERSAEPIPPPPDDDTGDDDVETSVMIYPAMGALGVLIVLAVIIWLFLTRRYPPGHLPEREDEREDAVNDMHD